MAFGMAEKGQEFTRQYQRQGYVYLPNVLQTSQIDTLCRELDVWQNLNTDKTDLGILHNNIWKEIPFFKDIIHQGDLGSIAAHLMKSDTAIFFQDMLVWKEPRNAQRVEWHQDYSYWPLDRPGGITIWIALDDATPENGFMQMVKGSHTIRIA